MSFSEVKDNLDAYIIPLHDVVWLRDEVRKAMTEGYAFPAEEDEIQKDASVVSDEMIIGYPDPENENMFMFGFKDDDCLDDQSIIDHITHRCWKDISEAGIVSFGEMESFSAVVYDEDVPNFRKHKTEVDNFLTHLIGRSIVSDEPSFLNNTAECKEFILERYDYENMKRTATNKWGNFNYRLFENDEGDVVTIVTYNAKLISYYNFRYKDEDL